MGPMNNSLTALRHKPYLLYSVAQLCSVAATCGQATAQDWLVLRLSHGSGTALGLTRAAQFLPIVVLSLPLGVLVDRLPVRLVFALEQTLAGLLAVFLVVLKVTGVLQVWHIIVIAALLGCCMAGTYALEQALIVEIVPDDLHDSAVGVRVIRFQLARILGPAAAGLVIAAGGMTFTFVADAATFAAVVLVVAVLPTTPRPRLERARGQIRETVAYARSDATLRPLMILAVGKCIVTWPFALVLVPLLARETGTGPRGFGLVTAAVVIGALAGQVEANARAKPGLASIGCRTALLGAAMTLAAATPSYWWAVALVAIPMSAVGYSGNVPAQKLIASRIPKGFEGRISGLYYVVGEGVAGLGAFGVGALATTIGARAALVVCGVLTAAMGFGVLSRHRPASAPPRTRTADDVRRFFSTITGRDVAARSTPEPADAGKADG